MRVGKIKIRVVLVTTLILLSACSSSTRQNEFSKEIAYPFETKTRATDFLSCFGDMLTAYRTRGNDLSLLRLAVVSVKDATDVSTVAYANSEIPSNFMDTTLSLISRIGGPTRVVHIPASNEIMDAARYGSLAPSGSAFTPYLQNFTATHYRSDTLQLYGALTEYDRFISSNQRSIDGSGEFGGGSFITNLEASASGIVNAARMTMDFRVVYAGIGDVVNHASSSNTVNVYQRGYDKSFGISIDGNAIGYSTSRSIVDARHKAIRLLIEWGLIKTIGKYAQVPYWKCLPNSDNKNNVSFKDLVSESNLYNFNAYNRNNKRKLANNKSGSGFRDSRDKELINAMLSYFSNAEYAKNNNRRTTKRSENEKTLVLRSRITVPDPKYKNKTIDKTVDKKSKIIGKSTLRNRVLDMYKSDKKYANLPRNVLLKRLHHEFVKAKILHPKDNMMGAETYLALWLNAPVKKGARWRK